jgi:16S rRNA pseudouridine516 synthase
LLLRQVLFSQGFGTRRECDALIGNGLVQVGGRVIDDPGEDVATEGLVYSVRGQDWAYHDKALLMMNKPPGYECSRRSAGSTKTPPACCSSPTTVR